jgi:hypothetical protein
VFSEVVSLMHLDSLILCGLWVSCKVSERYHSHVSGMLDHLADEKYPGFPLEGHTCMCVEKERSIRALVRCGGREVTGTARNFFLDMSWTDIGSGFIYTRQVNRVDQEISRSKGRGALLCEVRLATRSMRPSSDSEAKDLSMFGSALPCEGGLQRWTQLPQYAPQLLARDQGQSTRWWSCYK